MSNHEEEKRIPQGNQGVEKDDLSRRQFISDVAIKAAVAALFGAVTFDSVMARAMDRVNEVQAAQRVGAGAADDIHRYSPMNSSCTNNFDCTSYFGYVCSGGYSCGAAGGSNGFQCDYNFDCQSGFSCKASAGSDFSCLDIFNCDQSNTCTVYTEC